MLHLLRRHPLAVRAHFRHVVVLTYAFPAHALHPLLPAALQLDTFCAEEELGFLAIALVQTEDLRPALLPACLGQDFFLSGYRIFARFNAEQGARLRGLKILRSDTDRRLMVCAGNALTHYNYHLCRAHLAESATHLDLSVQTPGGAADLELQVALAEAPALPVGSPFSNWAQARRYAGPLPYTFDYEPETHSVVRILGVRTCWTPTPVEVCVRRCTFLDQEPFIVFLRGSRARFISRTFRIAGNAVSSNRCLALPKGASHARHLDADRRPAPLSRAVPGPEL